VADDNTDMREYVGHVLSQRYDIETVANGAMALAAARAQPPDPMLTAVMMPGLDGFELLRELRADPRTKTIPVILLSVRAGEELHIEGLDAGADDYLVKPFSARELLARMSTHLEMGRIRRYTAERKQRCRAEIPSLLGTAGTASLLRHWTRLHSQVAAFKRIFRLISLLYLATIIPALLMVPPKGEKVGGLHNG
jgi:DNA-binding response OmpR family regulator